jgi:succinate-semialdehyde dehydrogenase/glutarate-semialdehyde dehydrogenase
MTTQALQDHILFQTGYLVNGIWKTLDTTFDVLNPATGEVIAKVAKAGKAQTEEAIAAATKAFPAWRAKTAKERSAILYRWYELIIENKSWLGRLMTTEQGKPLKEAEGEWSTLPALSSGLPKRPSARTVKLFRRSNPARAFWRPANP